MAKLLAHVSFLSALLLLAAIPKANGVTCQMVGRSCDFDKCKNITGGDCIAVGNSCQLIRSTSIWTWDHCRNCDCNALFEKGFAGAGKHAVAVTAGKKRRLSKAKRGGGKGGRLGRGGRARGRGGRKSKKRGH